MRFQVLSLVIIHMVVMRRSWCMELLLSLVGGGVLASASAPCGDLRAGHRTMLRLHGVMQLVVAGSWPIHLLWAQVWLGAERRFKATAVWFGPWRVSLVVEA